MNRRMQLMLGVAGLLAVLVAADYIRRGQDDGGLEVVRRTAPDPAPATETGPFLPGFTAFEAIDNRPVFSPDRRPPARPEPTPETTRPAETVAALGEPAFLITGIASGPDGRRVAIVREAGQSRRVYAGDVVDGWRVESVEPGTVVVSQRGERWRLPVGERDR